MSGCGVEYVDIDLLANGGPRSTTGGAAEQCA
ncbi:hypothetical protein Y599_1627 [Burkholderia pseudomallei MSHR3458]|nr:hypothetical protein Y044_1836 [Burkholderia pseudomallei MSHR2243]AIV70849.1 hypothetical protein Y028_791 [Burkholderia pseudomallei MSHR62]KGU67436.1 hypothetical protein Y035_585 [Burkholderia pseudomallei MSHR465J]KGW69041.1 hypothetical protein Y599_1627 [Burkholderia pseudomallei MSHR3458]KGX48020.1 hypothetical protein Y043_6286 [Burkholderia pseudomallei MSHR2138]KGX48126.1 hypothetical protein Y600_5781 [Burkholderia pseudomallei MSHR3709]